MGTLPRKERRLAALLTALLLAGPLLLAGAARADGDPASDYLLTRQVFLSALPGSPTAAQRQLLATVAAANRAGFQVRVALIGNAYDLGAINVLWRQPATYARFLGVELSGVYRGRLLVAMPDGFGFNWPGHPAASAYGALDRLRVGTGADGLAAAASGAVRTLAAAAGVRLGEAGRGSTDRPGGSGSGRAILIALLALAALALAIGLVRARRSLASLLTLASGRRAAIGGGLLAGLAVAGVAVAAVRLHQASAASPGGSGIVTRPPVSWAAGQRMAPAFALRGESGGAVSPAAFRGRPVIVTFIDPLCRNLCPLEAQVLNQAVARLPAAEKPAIIAVSVDVYADRRAYLLQDDRVWRLVPEWHWAVGSPRSLAAVWRRYQIGVRVVTRRVDRLALHYVTHTEAAYVIDASGHLRALFEWPFWPQDVVHEVRGLS